MTRDPRFPRRHLTERNRVPPGGWMIPAALVGAAIWGAIFMWWPL